MSTPIAEPDFNVVRVENLEKDVKELWSKQDDTKYKETMGVLAKNKLKLLLLIDECKSTFN